MIFHESGDEDNPGKFPVRFGAVRLHGETQGGALALSDVVVCVAEYPAKTANVKDRAAV